MTQLNDNSLHNSKILAAYNKRFEQNAGWTEAESAANLYSAFVIWATLNK
jgi:hypothetical protein